MSGSPFADAKRLQQVLRAAILAWLVLVLAEIVTGNVWAGFAADALVAVGMVVGGVGYLLFVGTGRPRLAAAAALLVVGGVLTGYEAFVPLDVVAARPALSVVRLGVVLIAIALYFWERRGS
ncbi:MAG: hypothetical protein ABEI96_11525 [Haloarculaceae archaeon]